MNRYEFRIWGDDLSNVAQQLEVLSVKAYPTETDEIYFVSNATDDCNAKIRFGLLDIKVLLKVERGLEQWSPIINAGSSGRHTRERPVVFPVAEFVRRGEPLSCPRLPVINRYDSPAAIAHDARFAPVQWTILHNCRLVECNGLPDQYRAGR